MVVLIVYCTTKIKVIEIYVNIPQHTKNELIYKEEKSITKFRNSDYY